MRNNAKAISDLEKLIESVPLDRRLAWIEHAMGTMTERDRKRFEDVLSIAAARCDDIKAIEYVMKTPKGKPIKLGVCQKLMVDFGNEAHAEGLISIIYAPMGTGKTTVMLGKRAIKIGKDITIRLQIVSASDEPAIERCQGLQKLIESRHYLRVYPHVKRGPIWAKHKFTVDRAALGEEELREEFDEEGESGAINATCSAYGADSGALGSRSDDSLFDDVPNYENSIEFPSKGEHVYNKIKTKFFSRRESPLGTGEDEHYDRKDDPWRAEFICTPWAETDPVYKLRYLPTAAVIRMGVNSDFTGYNVEIWGLNDQAIERLRAKYAVGPGEEVDTEYKPKAIFTIPLFRHRQWYLDRYGEDEREFDRMYRCKVYTEAERAFPEFTKCLVEDLDVRRTPILIDRDNKKDVPTGWLAEVINPTKDYAYKLATVDLSGAARPGTVIQTQTLIAPDYTRELVESAVGAWAGNEIVDQMGKVFERHPDLDLMLVEDAAQQKMFIQLAIANRERYPFMMKVGFFEGVSHKKKDQQLGVLTMATPFANLGFRIANTLNMADHPRFGSTNYPKGCPCGMCRVIRDCKTQLRTAEVKSDDIMCLWMNHTSMPMSLKNNNTQTEASVVERVQNGYQLMMMKNESPNWGGTLTGSGTLPASIAVEQGKNPETEPDGAGYMGRRARWTRLRT